MTNLPVYLMSLFRMPKSVSSRLEKIQRDFLWGSSSTKRKIHLIKWENVCRCKMKEGLGIKSLFLMNKALLTKWAKRFAEEENTFWKIVISLKYGTEGGGWFLKPPRGNAGKGLRKEIHSKAMNLKQNCIFELGEGNRIRFK